MTNRRATGVCGGLGAFAVSAVLFAVMSFLGGGALADEAPGAPADWREQALAEGLTEEEIAALAERKVLIGVRSFRQIFSAYAACPVSVFVTSDSVLRAYNVLLEESLGRVERARAARLGPLLRSIWEGLPTAIPDDAELDRECVLAATRRAQVTIGTSLRLLGEETSGASPEVAAFIEEEVALVMGATGVRRPGWLGPSEDPLDALDYDRFRPRSFYVGDEDMERYYRAVAWLQDVPFHLQRDDDLLTVVVLLEAFGPSRDGDPARLRARAACEEFVRGYARFLGNGGEPSIYSTGGGWFGVFDQGHVDVTRDTYLRHHPDLPDGERWSADLVVHVLPRIETPDGRLLGRVFEARRAALTPHLLPTGLDLAAALGSDYARQRRVEPGTRHAEVLADWPELDRGKDLLRLYFRTLALLVDPPEGEAPSFLRSEAWAAKSVNTVLAAWAQIRHAWALSAMDAMGVLGTYPVEPGWVEPDPEFFARLLDLSIATESALKDAAAFDTEVGLLTEISDLRWFVRTISALEGAGGLDGGYDALYDALAPGQERRLQRVWGSLWNSGWTRYRESTNDEEREKRTKDQQKGDILRHMAAVAQEALDEVDELRRTDPRWTDRYRDPARLQKRWQALQLLVHRLEGLANKQLRGRPFDESDAEFLRGYAGKLAYPMLYDGNVFTHPPADLPPVAAVFSGYPPTTSPSADRTPQVVHAAVAMPCAIYVLWPHEDREVLCRGGVMPYREFVEPTRLTDDQWRRRLRSPEAPPAPDWLASITVPLRSAAKKR